MKQSCDELLTLAINLHLHGIAAPSAFMSAFARQRATLVDACDHLSVTQTQALFAFQLGSNHSPASRSLV